MSCMIPPKPPVPKTTRQFYISQEEATQKASRVRKKLFEEAKEKAYLAISAAVDNGYYHVQCSFHENCNYADIKAFEQELIEQGFKVSFESGIPRDKLEISWYPKE
jgi:hypothetical protein